MAAHSIKTVQKIPISLERAWEFFSNPANLQAITPDNMGFKDEINYQGGDTIELQSVNLSYSIENIYEDIIFEVVK